LKPLRILLATTHYGEAVREYSAAMEMARTLCELGHQVQVVVTAWRLPAGGPTRSYREPFGADVLLIMPRAIDRLGRAVKLITKWLATPLHSYRETKKALAGREFDLMIGFTIATASGGPMLWAFRHCRRSLLWIADFFPSHHKELGEVPGGPAFWMARATETYLFRRFDAIGCFSPSAMVYLRENYRLRDDQTVVTIPQWGRVDPPAFAPRGQLLREHGLPADRRILVFGGGIGRGRGIELILEMSLLAETERPDLLFLFIGQGDLVHLVEKRIREGAANVALEPAMARDEYLQLISACDLGLVSTVADVGVPAFPSKTWDYLRAGLPVVASVEIAGDASNPDYGGMVEQYGFGRIVPAGDARKFLDAILSVIDDEKQMQRMSDAGRRALEEVHDARSAVRRILEATCLAEQA
jgi:glycosyltransferase involved in cell wall biosynthesis